MHGRNARPAGARRALRPYAAAGLACLVLLAPATASAAPADDPPDRTVTAPVSGEAAVDALGPDLPAVASEHGLAPSRLEALLETDSTLAVDRTGRLLYVDEAQAEPAQATQAQQAPFPYSSTFSLHSAPGANRVIHLDFDGHVVSGTAWNTNGVSTARQPAFDMDGAPATFSPQEQDLVQSVWQRVSEDFAPFGVDVTTEEPAADRITRSSSTDTTFGTRVLITPSTQAHSTACGGGCGGVAYVDVYDMPGNDHYQPAWVFSQTMWDDPKLIAEAVSHEAGHNLGLRHDGTATQGYYGGHGSWAPIMGVGYDAPLSQWSAGTYAGANNTQDDLLVMQGNGAPLRADDHGDGVADATVLADTTGPATGVIASRTDRDVFRVTTSCPGRLEAQARPAATSPNLDVQLRLLSSSGEQLTLADPPSRAASYDVALGLDAALDGELSAGTYFLEVDGTGAGDPSTGYDDYGSLGAYSLTVSACGEVAPGVPGAPTEVSATPTSATAARVSFTPPASDGGGAITSYAASCTSTTGGVARAVSGTAGPLVVAGLSSGSTYACTVRASNAFGAGEVSAASALFVAKAPPTAPGAPSGVRAVATSATDARVTFTPPRSNGGSPVTGYETLCTSTTGGASAPAAGAASPLLVGGLTTGHSYRCTVRATNVAGTGPASSASAAFVAKAPPTAPGAPSAVVAAATSASVARISFAPPASDGGKPVRSYAALCTSSDGGIVRTASGSRAPLQVRGLTTGATYACTVQARNAVGIGGASEGSAAFVAKAPPTAPKVPSLVKAIAASATQAGVSFGAPVSDGGSPVTGYEVLCTSTNGGAPAAQTVSTGPLVVDGLTTGASYRCRVRAVNAVGASPWSTSTASFVVKA